MGNMLSGILLKAQDASLKRLNTKWISILYTEWKMIKKLD